MKTKGCQVVYIDVHGKEHNALVTAVNGLNEGVLSLVYVDAKAHETDNVVKKIDVVNASDPSKDESNPDLPRYVVNAWKEAGEPHSAPPADHAMFDHPFR